MQVVTRKKFHIFSGRTNEPLAREIALTLDETLGEANLIEFAAGEIRCRFGHSVRGGDVFVLQTHAESEVGSVNDSIMEHLIMIDAAKRASAKRITAVMPFYGYARQDRKSAGREPITAKLLANMFKVAGADRLLSVDLHSGQIQGFFDGPVDHLTSMPVLIDYIERNRPSQELVVVSPDTGRVKVAERYAKHLGADVAAVYKKRSHDVANEVVALGVMGDVKDKTAILMDDMIDTAGTVCSAAEVLRANGASDVWAMATHGLFSGPAVDRLKNSVISRVAVTNTLPFPSEKQFDSLEILSCAGVIARAMKAIFEDSSVSEIFGGENFS
ncbi:MAG: ribose-phosphate diphosphokinase [Acidimicrobiales bacterium]